MTQCPNPSGKCLNPNNVEKASVIVERETQYSTEQRYGVTSGGQPATYSQRVMSQSTRAQALTADAPKEGNGCWRFLLAGFLLLYPTLGILLSCILLGSYTSMSRYARQGASQEIVILLLVLLVSVLVFIAIIVISNIVSRQQKKSFNRLYQSWYNQFDRRYYCNSCGTIFKI